VAFAFCAAATFRGLIARRATAFSFLATAVFLALLHAGFCLFAGAAGLPVFHPALPFTTAPGAILCVGGCMVTAFLCIACFRVMATALCLRGWS
jgi:hypothetical protein